MTMVIRQLRHDRNLSQAKLAARARISVRTVAAVEAGATCRLDTRRKLALALGVPVRDLAPPARSCVQIRADFVKLNRPWGDGGRPPYGGYR